MRKTNSKKRKKQQKSYIDKYKELKDNKMVLWNVGGKKVDASLSRWTKYKINNAYKESKKLGNKTGMYYPPRKTGQSTLSYIRHVNKIKRDSGIGETDINGILFEKQFVDKLKIKEGKLHITFENKTLKGTKEFISIDREQFNIDPERYLKEIFTEMQKRDFGELDLITPIHSHWTGDGTKIAYLDDIENFINQVTSWAYEYKGNMINAINDPDATSSEINNAVSKYDNFITGLWIEKFTRK